MFIQTLLSGLEPLSCFDYNIERANFSFEFRVQIQIQRKNFLV